MSFIDFMRIVRKSIVLLIATMAAGGLVGLGVYMIIPDEYSSRTELFVSAAEQANADEMQIASALVQERLRTYVDLADSRLVLQPVIRDLGLNTSPAELAKKVVAASEQGTVMLSVDVKAATPEEAARLSDSVSKSLITTITELETRSGKAESNIRLAVANEASIPRVTIGPRWWFCTAVGMLLGLALGISSALLRSAMDTKIRDNDGIRAVTSAPILASLPMRSETSAHSTSTVAQRDIIHSEAVRRLRTNLRFARIEDSNNSLVVTSSVPGEGKTSTSIDLAISLARNGQRVVLVDVDLRQPTIADRLGLENSAGLTTALVGLADVHDLLQPWGRDELYVLTAGESTPNPLELIESRAMAKLLAVLRNDFDTVILDCPPVLPVADGLLLAKSAGRIIHVIAVNETSRTELADALNDLSVVDTPLSLVVNKVPLTHSDLDGYANSYAAQAYGAPRSEEVSTATSGGSAIEPKAKAARMKPLGWLPGDVDSTSPARSPHVWPDRYFRESTGTALRSDTGEWKPESR